MADMANMADSPDDHIDIVSSADGDFELSPKPAAESVSRGGSAGDAPAADKSGPGSSPSAGPVAPRRLWVGIHFECCGVYKRVYRDPDVPFYEGQCPQCGRKITMRVGPDGVTSRIFKATPI
jgi:hypothetical protein